MSRKIEIEQRWLGPAPAGKSLSVSKKETRFRVFVEQYRAISAVSGAPWRSEDELRLQFDNYYGLSDWGDVCDRHTPKNLRKAALFVARGGDLTEDQVYGGFGVLSKGFRRDNTTLYFLMLLASLALLAMHL